MQKIHSEIYIVNFVIQFHYWIFVGTLMI